MTRAKKVLTIGVTRQQAEDAFAAYNQATANLQAIEAKMNQEVTAVRERYDKPIGELQDAANRHFEVLQVYAAEHPELFERKKSVEWTHGSFGYRTATPKLKTLKGFTWGAVKSIIERLWPDYVRTTVEINKELILANREAIADILPQMGVEVVQDETFYVAPNLQQLTPA
ncbi:MAG TPA: host-nuclease inhibitor Gam family protein [Phnomibacter sp.]|mgnify:CR=1 FL=1|nr:host-nuclease inhibitor Gam family protein [Phnomibacter sp.]